MLFEADVRIFNKHNCKEYIDNELEYMFSPENNLVVKNIRREEVFEIEESKEQIERKLNKIYTNRENNYIAVSFTYKKIDKMDYYSFVLDSLNKMLTGNIYIENEVEYDVLGGKVRTTFFIFKSKIKEEITDLFIEKMINVEDSEYVADFIQNKEVYFSVADEYLEYYEFMLSIFKEKKNDNINSYRSLVKIFKDNIGDFNIHIFNKVLGNLSVDVFKNDLYKSIKKEKMRERRKEKRNELNSEMFTPVKKEDTSLKSLEERIEEDLNGNKKVEVYNAENPEEGWDFSEYEKVEEIGKVSKDSNEGFLHEYELEMYLKNETDDKELIREFLEIAKERFINKQKQLYKHDFIIKKADEFLEKNKEQQEPIKEEISDSNINKVSENEKEVVFNHNIDISIKKPQIQPSSNSNIDKGKTKIISDMNVFERISKETPLKVKDLKAKNGNEIVSQFIKYYNKEKPLGLTIKKYLFIFKNNETEENYIKLRDKVFSIFGMTPIK